MIIKKAILICFFLIFFTFPVLSQEVFVSLNPLTHSVPVELYESEIAEFQLIVINNEEVEKRNFNAIVSVSGELTLIVNGKEKKEQRLTIVSLPPKSEKNKTIKVKGQNLSVNDLEIKIEYGFKDNLINSFSSKLKVLKNPIEVNARLEKTALEPLEENILLVDLTNTSGKEVRNLTASLVLPQGFDSSSNPLEFKIFAKEQSVLNSAFNFTAPEESVGEKNILLLIRYDDERGAHEIEKNFQVDVRNRDQFLLVLGGIVIALLLISFILNLRKKEVPKEEMGEETQEEETQEKSNDK